MEKIRDYEDAAINLIYDITSKNNFTNWSDKASKNEKIDISEKMLKHFEKTNDFAKCIIIKNAIKKIKHVQIKMDFIIRKSLHVFGDISNDLSNVVLPEEWIKNDKTHEYNITIYDNGLNVQDYIKIFYNFLGITSSMAEQLAIILKNKKVVHFKKIQDVELMGEYCEDLIVDNMNFEVTVTNV